MKRLNLDELLWFIILVLLNLSIIHLVFTKKLDFYVGKNMIKYMYITVVVLGVVTIFQTKNIFTCRGNSSIKIKFIPIIVALLLGVVSINNLQTFKHVELSKELMENKINSIDRETLYEYKINKDLGKDVKEKIYSNKEVIKVDENNPMVLEEIRINPEAYLGMKIEIHGFVCKENYLDKNQFIIGRILMTCCAADSKIIGIVGEYDRAYELKENNNIKAIGVIESSTIKDDNNVTHNIPVIKIKELQKE